MDAVQRAVEVWATAANAMGAADYGMVQGLMNAGAVVGIDGPIIIVAWPSELLTKRVKRFRQPIVAMLRLTQEEFIDVVMFTQEPN